MVDDVRPERGDDLLDRGEVCHVDAMQRCVRVDVVFAPGAEVVQHRHVVPCRHVSVDHVRTDETGAASDENLHRA